MTVTDDKSKKAGSNSEIISNNGSELGQPKVETVNGKGKSIGANASLTDDTESVKSNSELTYTC